jgi:hypothetical protein
MELLAMEERIEAAGIVSTFIYMKRSKSVSRYFFSNVSLYWFLLAVQV